MPWYLLNEENSKPIEVFRLCLGVPLFYQLLLNMLYVSVDSCSLWKMGDVQMILFYIIEVLFLFDLVLNFFTAPKTMTNPTLKLTSVHYLKRMFIFDFIATVVSNIVIQ